MADVAIQDRQRDNLVVGLGRTGFSVARHLCGRGERVRVTDRSAQPALLERLRSEVPDAEWLGANTAPAGVDRVVLSPGVPAGQPWIRDLVAGGAEVAGDIELFAEAVDARIPVIGVTGSNGKSTVVCLIAALLEGSGLEGGARRVLTGGNLGPPALDLLDEEDPEAYVLELSSFQLEATHSLDARAGVVLNLSEDHMDRYRDLAAYGEAKARLVEQSRVAVLNRDDAAVAAMADQAARVIWFGRGVPEAGGYGIMAVDGERWLVRGTERLLRTDRLALAGEHNRLNALAALATVEALGGDPVAAAGALEGFVGLAHRMEILAERDGRTWINDSKATNVAATVAALEGLDQPVVLIAGGQGKGQDFAPLGRALERGRVRGLVVFGEDAEDLAAVAPGDLALRRARDLTEAVHQARELSREGDAVLLSPACASFDQFAGFAERGEAFRALVEGPA